MANAKKIASLVTALAITAASSTGCMGYDTRVILTCNDIEVAAGVYIQYMMGELNNQQYRLYYSGVQSDDIMNLTVDEDGTSVSMSEHLQKYALDQTKQHVALALKFDEMELSLDDEDLSSMESVISSGWEQNGEYYEYMGVSRDSVQEAYEVSLKREAIFKAYYFDGGLEPVTDDEIESYLSDNYLRYKVIQINKNTDSESETFDSDNQTASENAEYFNALAQDASIDFASFDVLIESYEELTTSSDEDATSSEDSLTTDEEDDPYKNERILNYSTYSDNELYTFIKNMENGEKSMYEDDYSYYILAKADILERSDYIEENHDALINEMKVDDFTDLINGWVEALTFDVNSKALKRYDPDELYERNNKYTSN